MNDIRDYLAKIGRKGGKARLTKMTAEERKAVARKAIRARWARADKLIKELKDAEKEVLQAESKSKRKPKGKT